MEENKNNFDFKDDFLMYKGNHNTIQCHFCQKNFLDDDTDKFWYLVTCYHCICRGCLIKHILSNYVKEKGQVKCPLPLCDSVMLEYDLKVWFFIKKLNIFIFQTVIGAEKLEKLNQELVEIEFNIITCFKCQEKFEFVEGKQDPKTKDEKGRLLTP